MTNNEIIVNLFEKDGIRDLQFMKYHVHVDCELEWHSSKGFIKWNKTDLLKFSEELKNNYITSKFDIKYFFEQGNIVSVHYNYFASTIENPTDLFLIGRFATVWEIKDSKLFKCYQISQID